MEKVDYINISQYDETMTERFQLMFCIYNFSTRIDSCMNNASNKLDIVKDQKSYSKSFRCFSYTVRM